VQHSIKAHGVKLDAPVFCSYKHCEHLVKNVGVEVGKNHYHFRCYIKHRDETTVRTVLERFR
jgi:hypothetical protein